MSAMRVDDHVRGAVVGDIWPVSADVFNMTEPRLLVRGSDQHTARHRPEIVVQCVRQGNRQRSDFDGDGVRRHAQAGQCSLNNRTRLFTNDSYTEAVVAFVNVPDHDA